MSGYDVLKQLRVSKIKTPILILSGLAGIEDKVKGLGVGADDYMTKPFSTRELVARVHALLRRIDRDRAEGGAATVDAPIAVGDVVLDPGTRRVTRAGQVVHLTPTEFDLFAFLASAPDRVFTRDELLGEVWGYEVASGGRAVDSHVRAVRQKLGNNLIRTVHGVGFALEEAGAE
jgi:DNA-binding response OmpR family regulator